MERELCSARLLLQKPAHHVDAPRIPTQKPAHHVDAPRIPTQKPAHHVDAPRIPTQKPAHHVDAPRIPTQKPAHHVDAPRIPTQKPAHHVDAPRIPTQKLAHHVDALRIPTQKLARRIQRTNFCGGELPAPDFAAVGALIDDGIKTQSGLDDAAVLATAGRDARCLRRRGSDQSRLKSMIACHTSVGWIMPISQSSSSSRLPAYQVTSTRS